MTSKKKSWVTSIKHDLPAGLVVFLVALPLCLGIALASGAPLFSGVLAGIIGGLVVSLVSGSPLSVSGPAAGLTVIVASAIITLGSYQAFLVSIVLAGILQVVLGFLKAGTIGNYFPSNVIKGMLTAIGIILILKQIPHAFGYDADFFGDFNFIQPNQENTFSELRNAVKSGHIGATMISSISLLIFFLWSYVPAKIKLIPAALVVVVVSILLNHALGIWSPGLKLDGEHVVQLPVVQSGSDFLGLFVFPDWSQLLNPQIYIVAGTLALIASLETLLSVEAIDKLDPMKRNTPTNRELKAQGIGNVLSGLLGGLPITAVIVRGSANVNAGAQTKMASFIHGVFLFASLLLFPNLMNQIPLAALAAILLVVGYKLTKLSLYKEMYQAGWDQFIPFMVTVVAIVFTDLLVGIAIGLCVAVFYILKRNMRNVYSTRKQPYVLNEPIRIMLSEEVSFLNKASIQATLNDLPEDSQVIIDGSQSSYIDYDVLEIINDFKVVAETRNIALEFIEVEDKYRERTVAGAKVVQQSYEQLLDNNKQWALHKNHIDNFYFQNQTEGQTPKFFLIACSDSRILPNEFTGTGTGEMFIHRNIANLVLDDDKNLMAALQYAIDVLKVEHIIVCGHYGCGGIRGAVDRSVDGAVGDWIESIRSTHMENLTELNKLGDQDRYERMVELNVIQQIEKLKNNQFVMRAKQRSQTLSLHGWVYNISNGLITDLEIGTDVVGAAAMKV